MSRLTITFDRVFAFLVAVVLITVGCAATVWGTNRIDSFTGTLDLGLAADAADQPWWPWAIGIGGAALTLLALRWLFSHLPRRGTGPLKLTGTARTGRLVADGDSVAEAAAAALAVAPGVRSARGRILNERGQVIARLNATIDADTDLSEIAASADDVSAQLRRVLGRDDLRCQVQLRLASRNQHRTRVH